MTSRLFLAAAAALLLAGCAGRPHAVVTAPTPPAAQLKLADWNMEFVAERNDTGCHPRSDADYAALRRTVEAIDADVFAFEEVENEAAAARVFDPARYTIVMERRPGEVSGMCGGEHPDKAYIRQAVGIAVRRGLPFDRRPDLTALQLGNPNLRSGVDIVVRPARGEPLRVLAVHLKSGCFQRSEGNACPTILQQAPVMRAWIADAAKGPRFAIMGDWNRRLAVPGDLFWAGLDRQGVAGLMLSDAGVVPRCDPRYRDFIDHIVLDRRAAPQASGFAETVFGLGANPSDHCPISIQITR